MSKVEHPQEPLPLQAEICPHLGLEEDEQTCTAYPSRWNLCHRSRPIAVVRLEHQRKICLSSHHIKCPVFQSETLQALPVQLRGRRRVAGKKSPHLIIPTTKGS